MKFEILPISHKKNKTLSFQFSTNRFSVLMFFLFVFSGHQTTNKRQEAREIVKKATNASPDLDAVIFTGSGCTGAIHKLLAILDLNQASNEIKSCQKY